MHISNFPHIVYKHMNVCILFYIWLSQYTRNYNCNIHNRTIYYRLTTNYIYIHGGLVLQLLAFFFALAFLLRCNTVTLPS